MEQLFAKKVEGQSVGEIQESDAISEIHKFVCRVKSMCCKCRNIDYET
jgi:hypothetical protein